MKRKSQSISEGADSHVAVTNNSLHFVKYQGLGNDFILIDNTTSVNLKYTSQQAVKLCSRNFGIGADGLIFALPGQHACDYTMRIYNSDGTEPQMCGNGIRCLAKFLHRLELKGSNDTSSFRIWTNAGVIVASIQADGLVQVAMGEPVLDRDSIPTKLSVNKQVAEPAEKYASGAVVDSEMRVWGSFFPMGCEVFLSTAVSMGNPHSVSSVVHVLVLHNSPFYEPMM